jgi:hypothetical protein
MMSDTHSLNDFTDHVATTYRKRILEILDDDRLPLYLREHFSESPDYYANLNLYKMVDTLAWLTYSDNQKREILDRELDEYFA